VLGVDGNNLGARACGYGHEELARRDDQFLIRDGDLHAALDRGEDRVECDRAVGTRDDDVRAALRRNGDEHRGAARDARFRRDGHP